MLKNTSSNKYITWLSLFNIGFKYSVWAYPNLKKKAPARFTTKDSERNWIKKKSRNKNEKQSSEIYNVLDLLFYLLLFSFI